MAPNADKVRRPGYAPASNTGVGRRGLHTRDRILTSAADVFLANGFHSTSLDTIAKAAKSSRATVYQYFAGKEEIFGELSAAAAHDVLDHGDRLGGLGPTADGVNALHRWLLDWADIYDAHAAAFAEYPGIGTEMGVVDIGNVAETFAEKVAARVQAADLTGLDPDDAAAALMRIPHMVHLYRRRAMFPLPDRTVTSWSLTVALQLMLFPDTPADALPAARPHDLDMAASPSPVRGRVGSTPSAAVRPPSPIAQDVLSVSSALFAERGYHAVGMEEIAAAADVSRATLYRYFSTKVEILAELTRRAVTEIDEHAAALPKTTAGPWQEWSLGYVRFHRSYQGVIRAWFDGTVAEHLSGTETEHGISAIHRAVRALLDNVALPADIDVEVAAAVFLAVLGRMTEPTKPGAAESDEHTAALMLDLLKRSLLRPG